MIENDRNYKLYALLFPGGEMYFGQTKQTLQERFSGGYGGIAKKAIEYYGKENVQMVLLRDGLTKNQVDMLEQQVIERYGGVNNEYILNEQTGGTSGFRMSDRVIDNQKKRYAENPELKKRVSKHNCRPICQYTIQGEFVRCYNSIQEASVITGISANGIQACASGNYKISGGYIWAYMYERDSEKKIPIVEVQIPQYDGLPKPVMQFTKDGTPIARYKSINEARRKTGIHHIGDCVNGKTAYAGGYIWKLIEE